MKPPHGNHLLPLGWGVAKGQDRLGTIFWNRLVESDCSVGCG